MDVELSNNSDEQLIFLLMSTIKELIKRKYNINKYINDSASNKNKHNIYDNPLNY
ncbi:hypothetical protein QKC54_gp0240 [Megavirus baoshan]|uniref:Uncharacterized protein n=1 Tax=Megavirus baoshan TaxID=2496520 RepID=A0A8K1W8A5_9VIRU|nr:hypothetical protein QKC54_gp0240 [Megavirus baoshan]UFX99867.1 hypothetical protein Mb0832 [Megavirus baoshan]